MLGYHNTIGYIKWENVDVKFALNIIFSAFFALALSWKDIHHFYWSILFIFTNIWHISCTDIHKIFQLNYEDIHQYKWFASCVIHEKILTKLSALLLWVLIKLFTSSTLLTYLNTCKDIHQIFTLICLYINQIFWSYVLCVLSCLPAIRDLNLVPQLKSRNTSFVSPQINLFLALKFY